MTLIHIFLDILYIFPPVLSVPNKLQVYNLAWIQPNMSRFFYCCKPDALLLYWSNLLNSAELHRTQLNFNTLCCDNLLYWTAILVQRCRKSRFVLDNCFLGVAIYFCLKLQFWWKRPLRSCSVFGILDPGIPSFCNSAAVPVWKLPF